MLVSIWMTKKLVTVRPETPIAEAASEMNRRSIRRVLVAEGSGEELHLLGIVSTTDIARAFPRDVNPLSPVAHERGSQRPVSEIMTRNVLTTTPETPIEDAARVLRDHKIGAMPVVRGQSLVGIITESDIFRAFIEVLGVREEGVRVMFDLSKEEDLFSVVAEMGKRHLMRVASLLTMVHEGKRLGVVRLLGVEADRFIDAVWKSGHRVLSVTRSAGNMEVAPAGARG